MHGINHADDFVTWTEEVLLDKFNPFSDSCKWYDHEDHMAQFSYDHPDETFILEGRGEDDDDVWKLWVRNGHTCRVKAEIVFREPKADDFVKSNVKRIKKPSPESVLEMLKTRRSSIPYRDLAMIESITVDDRVFNVKTCVNRLVIDVGAGITAPIPDELYGRIQSITMRTPKK